MWYGFKLRLRMSSGALPGPDLLRAIPGVLREGNSLGGGV